MKRRPLTPAIAALALLAPSVALAAGPVGKWRVGDGGAIIALRACGAGLCGTIDAVPEKGAVDENNPNPAQRTRPLVGLPILSLQKSGDKQWSGTIYNAKDGQNYQASLTQVNETQLTLEGCVPGTNICGEDHWTKAR
jgi:uncharacterized protein (DUF2147 family)